MKAKWSNIPFALRTSNLMSLASVSTRVLSLLAFEKNMKVDVICVCVLTDLFAGFFVDVCVDFTHARKQYFSLSQHFSTTKCDGLVKIQI